MNKISFYKNFQILIFLFSVLRGLPAFPQNQILVPNSPDCSVFTSKKSNKTFDSIATSNLKLNQKADFILVGKSARKLILFSNGKPLKSYNVSLGGNPKGHKQEEGDLRTPEGLYSIDFKNWNSQFRRALRIDYPNKKDVARAESEGVPPGGNIMIHGEPNDSAKKTRLRTYVAKKGRWDWTEGCIAVTDREIDEIYQAIDLKVKVLICK